jgi:hypothetical protein
MDILANRRPYVAVALGNRADLSQNGAGGAPSRIDNWLWQSYLNIGMSYSFSESNATAQTQWQTAQDSIPYPAAARAVKNVAFFRQDGTPIKIGWKDIAYIRRYPAQSFSGQQNIGPPAIIATFGQQIFVRPLCDQSLYNVYIDFWTKPQQIVGQGSVNPPYVSLGAADIGATLLQVPDDWFEIIDMGAMLRGYTSLGERDKAQELQQLLFGFTVPTSGKLVPGLIATMWTRRQAEAPGMDYNIQPTSTKRSFTNVGG